MPLKRKLIDKKLKGTKVQAEGGLTPRVENEFAN
jgi:hypothetical protein